jgi:transposase-like protein
MGTSVEAVTTDTLGRRTGPRQLRTNEEKRRIVEETLKPGASVAIVARAHGVNANLVFGWRRLYQKGLLEENPATPAAPLLPVRVTSPTVVPKRAYKRRLHSMTGAARKPRGDFLEIDLASGGRVRIHGKAATRILERLVEELCRR